MTFALMLCVVLGVDGGSERDRFAAELEVVLRENFPGRAVTYDSAAFTFMVAGLPAAVNLGNIFGSWTTAGTDAAKLGTLKKVAASVELSLSGGEGAISDRFEEARMHLLPRVRDQASAEISALSFERDGLKPDRRVEKRLGSHLRVVVVYDVGHGLMDVGESYSKTWKRTVDEIVAAALENVPRMPFELIQPGVYVASNRDDLEASRLLLESETRKLELKGRPIAFAVHRRFLVVTGDQDVVGIEKATELVKSENDKPYPISVVPLRYEGHRWVTYRVPVTTVAGRALDELRLEEEKQIAAERDELRAHLKEQRRRGAVK